MLALLTAVAVAWAPPTERENGDSLTSEELSSYEIGVKCTGQSEETIPGIVSTEYNLPARFAGCSVRVKVYDVDGLSSGWSDPIELKKPTITAPRRGGVR